MERKMCAAFLSSVYENLKSERAEAISALWNNNMIPLCMEHFVISASDNFNGLKRKIDDSDIFVLLFGASYGSCDEADGISWTEKEYDYAIENQKPILSIACQGMISLLQRASRLERGEPREDDSPLSESEKKQLAFYKKVGFTIKVSAENRIETIITQFCTPELLRGCRGWVRKKEISPAERAKWERRHKSFDVGGEWYHVHLSNDDENYIRIGTVTVTQEFSPEQYQSIRMTGRNSAATVKDGVLAEKPFTRTNWNGSYTVDDEGNVIGIFNAVKTSAERYGNEMVKQGKTRGIHEFMLIPEDNTETTAIQGFFYDQAPSKKNGMIYLFRNREERDMMIRDVRPHLFD